MQAVVNLFRGSACVVISGVFPERFLNLCSQKGVAFWRLEWLDQHALRLHVARKDLRRLASIADRTCCEVTIQKRAGLPFFLGRFRKRYGLIIGFALSLAVVCILSRFILTIEVSGSERVSAAAIVSELRRQGVTIGTYGPSVDERAVSHRVLLSLRSLSFCSINLHGTRAEVIVREAETAPEIVEEGVPANIIAAATGIITHMEVRSGEAKFKKGDTVLAGEILISGVVDLKEPAYSSGDLGVMLVHAQGTVTARTWRTLKGAIPVEAAVKCYTGAEKRLISLSILGRRINFYGNGGISFPEYDKITACKTLILPGGAVMPLTLRLETYRAYTTESVPIDAAAAEEMITQQLDKRLRAAIGDGTVLRTDVLAAPQDALLTVTLLAECSEQIAHTVPLAAP